jgi:hypothetical protein
MVPRKFAYLTPQYFDEQSYLGGGELNQGRSELLADLAAETVSDSSHGFRGCPSPFIFPSPNFSRPLRTFRDSAVSARVSRRARVAGDAGPVKLHAAAELIRAR